MIVVTWEDGSFPLPKSDKFEVTLVNPIWLDKIFENESVNPKDFRFSLKSFHILVFDELQ